MVDPLDKKSRVCSIINAKRQVKCGAPQGIIFGPILSVVINDLYSIDPCRTVIIYADDTVFIYKDKGLVQTKS